MSFDHSKLRALVIEKFGKQYVFAKRLGVSNHTVSQWLNDKVDLSRDSIIRMADALEIPYSEIGTYFFTPKVQAN